MRKIIRCKYCNAKCKSNCGYAMKTKLNGISRDDYFIYTISSKFYLVNYSQHKLYLKKLIVKHNFEHSTYEGVNFIICKQCYSKQVNNIYKQTNFNRRLRNRV